MIAKEVVPGLQRELPFVNVAGTYPFFFRQELLNDRDREVVLKILSRLPASYKENFVKVMGYFAEQSTIAAKNMPDTVPVKGIIGKGSRRMCGMG
jgi:hypothetical protein